ncbi:HAD-IIB family hydrolase [Paenibacillus solisilvae]|uniref:HAD-IIB family hydrolase n=1 Tax=Paenibacillus solisilvae TaxID=2486751 RepID=A0ABW0VPI6_9BACL
MDSILDLDGTICFGGNPVSEPIVHALEKVQSVGHHVIFSSARPIRDMLPVLDKRLHHCTMIGGNGSLIFQDGKMRSAAFREDQRKHLMRLIEKYEATYLIDGEWDYSYRGPEGHPVLNYVDALNLARNVPVEDHPFIVKLLIITANNVEQLVFELKGMDVAVHRYQNDPIVDISPQNTDKYTALKQLGIQNGHYIAFGNDTNDVTMFQGAAHTHRGLGKYASERIALNGDFEREIASKLLWLSLQHR